MLSNNGADHDPQGNNSFVSVLAGTVLLGVAAFGLSLLLNTPFGAQFSLQPNDFLIGVTATLPLVIFLWWFTNTNIASLAAFRRSQIEFFASLGFTFTPRRIVLMAIAAGISEELLFRGVFLIWLHYFFPMIVAILLSNVVFGLLHMRTALYALIAGCVGVYLSAIYVATGNLLAPITTHILYDAVALEYTRRAIANARRAGFL